MPCHRVQPFAVSNHSVKSCLICVVRSESSGFWDYPLKTKLKTTEVSWLNLSQQGGPTQPLAVGDNQKRTSEETRGLKYRHLSR